VTKNESQIICCNENVFTGCPTNVTISSSTGDSMLSNQTVFTCTSVGGYPPPIYKWYINSVIDETTSPHYSIRRKGEFSLSCVATSEAEGLSKCSNNQTTSGYAIGW
jgi:hypothetical protein